MLKLLDQNADVGLATSNVALHSMQFTGHAYCTDSSLVVYMTIWQRQPPMQSRGLLALMDNSGKGCDLCQGSS